MYNNVFLLKHIIVLTVLIGFISIEKDYDYIFIFYDFEIKCSE
jgi:hypothetical protein